MTKKIKLPTILGVALLIIGTFLGVFLVNKNQIFRLGASGEIQPKDIRVSNITDSSLTISWVTDKETGGFVILNDTTEGQTDTKTFTHAVTINGLTPSKNYQYKINSDGTLFDNNGIPWSTQTGPAIGAQPSSYLISGSIIKATGTPVGNALVYANIGGYLLSTISSSTGNYVFQLGSSRTSNLSNYVTIDPSKTLIEIFVEATTQDVSSAQIYPQSARPVPAMVLGQTHDFKSLPPSQEGENPTATLSAPSQENQTSKFSVPSSLTTPPPENVTLDNIKDGEIVTSTKPDFFGAGPAGTKITVTVQSSDPVTKEVQISQKGSWNFSLGQALSSGAHKITITWIDAAGISRTLNRNFIVQAGELPAFEATPSKSLSPSASPTSTPRGTSTPKASASPTAIPVPSTGDLTPTLLFSMLGVAVIALSYAVWKYSTTNSQ